MPDDERLKSLEETVRALDGLVSRHDVRLDGLEHRADALEAALANLTRYVTRAFALLTEQRQDLARIDANVRRTLELLQPQVKL